MNVRNLIKELKKHPMDSEVGVQDQDAGEFEFGAIVWSVNKFQQDKSEMKNYGKNVHVVIKCG